MSTPGYRQLTDEEKNLIQSIRDKGSELETLINTISSLPETDKRWASIGKTHFQEGLMALVRSITKPDFF